MFGRQAMRWPVMRASLVGGLVSALASASIWLAHTDLARAQEPPSALADKLDRIAFPIRPSANNRYLVDADGKQFLMVGDSPQNLIANLSVSDAAEFMANRRSYGVNALWINLFCITTESACRKDGTTYDGIAPFLTAGDLATPNPAYIQRADDMLRLAEQSGMVVLLNPIETISWLPVLRQNGIDKAFRYGQFLGNRFNSRANIIWLHGNDFQSWRDPQDAALVQAVARGIRSVDAIHMHTAELNFLTSGTLDDPSWGGLVELDAAYTYLPTFAQVSAEYERADHKPVFLVEAHYEGENNFLADGGSLENLRKQEYWTMLAGGSGQLYASGWSWRLEKGWQAHLDTPGILQLKVMKSLFAPRKWYELRPDVDHTTITGGYDAIACRAGRMAVWVAHFPSLERFVHTAKMTGYISANGCATAARTDDGSLVIAYMPTLRPLTVDMTRLAGPAVSRWYDPTDGSFTDVGGAPIANVGKVTLRPPNRNRAGDGDWVLVLETAGTR
jgi:uncharacterized protein DUF4038/collagenase-like protein with putative collagen-binding domain